MNLSEGKKEVDILAENLYYIIIILEISDFEIVLSILNYNLTTY